MRKGNKTNLYMDLHRHILVSRERDVGKDELLQPLRILECLILSFVLTYE